MQYRHMKIDVPNIRRFRHNGKRWASIDVRCLICGFVDKDVRIENVSSFQFTVGYLPADDWEKLATDTMFKHYNEYHREELILSALGELFNDEVGP